MKIKQLQWRDIVTQAGKKQGWVELSTYVKELSIIYYIKNHDYGLNQINDDFSLYDNYKKLGNYTTIEQAKKAAQTHFKETVLKLFFEDKYKRIRNIPERPAIPVLCKLCGQDEWELKIECPGCVRYANPDCCYHKEK